MDVKDGLEARVGHLDGKSVTLLTHHFSSAWFALFCFINLNHQSASRGSLFISPNLI